MSQDGEKAVIQAYVFPLVSWIWAGAWILFLGTFVCLVPSKVDRQISRTKILSAEVAEGSPELEEMPAQTGD
jgi:cytochrome c-type biogenesis protein CcmF